MRSFIIGLVAGVGWLQMQAALPAEFFVILLIAGSALVAFTCRKISYPFLKIVLQLISGVLLGFAWAALFAHLYLSVELPKELEGRDITLIGTVSSLPNHFERGVRFDFIVDEIKGDTSLVQSMPKKLALSWYEGAGEEPAEASETVKPGQRWQLTVRLKRPHGNANPSGFAYEAWLLEQNIRATGYVRPDRKSAYKNIKLDDFEFSVRNLVQLSRYEIREKILSALQDRQYAGVIVALVIGDQRGISQSDWDIFNRTGIGHLVSISGLHITMLAGLFAGIVFYLWRRSFFTKAQLPLLLPAQKAAALTGALTALLYVALAGFGVPAQRTLYMLCVVALALWFGQLTSVSVVLCLALGVVVLLDPWAVLWPGFWLSFSAVAVILYVSTGRISQHAVPMPSMSGKLAKVYSAVASATRMQLAITLGLVPLTLLLFGQVSIISPIANALAIPLISFVVTPLALAGSFMPESLSNGILQLAHAVMEWLSGFLAFLSRFEFAIWSVPVPSWWMFAAAMIGTIWMLAPRSWPVRWLGLALWVPLVINTASSPQEEEMWVTAFDVGQGSAILIETENHRLLYDTGPSYGPESDGGSRVIVPYLKARGIDALDVVIISHNDNDHSGGALSIFKTTRVDTVFSSLNPESPIVLAASSHQRCQAGEEWVWDKVRFEILFPDAADYENERRKTNAISCVLKVSLADKSILLPGDIEARQEKELLEHGMEKLASSVLLAPHHGSGTSSTEAFLQTVNPDVALFQVGYRNRFRHPKEEIYHRYGAMGIQRFRTDEAGAVSLKFASKTDILISGYRQDNKRYWHER